MTITDQSLGQLARSIPGATAIFHKHQLDFCCGGKKGLILFDRIDGALEVNHG